jgi:hypothetical protein
LPVEGFILKFHVGVPSCFGFIVRVSPLFAARLGPSRSFA